MWGWGWDEGGGVFGEWGAGRGGGNSSPSNKLAPRSICMFIFFFYTFLSFYFQFHFPNGLQGWNRFSCRSTVYLYKGYYIIIILHSEVLLQQV